MKIRNISVFILTHLEKQSESCFCMMTAVDLRSILCTVGISYHLYVENREAEKHKPKIRDSKVL